MLDEVHDQGPYFTLLIVRERMVFIYILSIALHVMQPLALLQYTVCSCDSGTGTIFSQLNGPGSIFVSGIKYQLGTDNMTILHTLYAHAVLQNTKILISIIVNGRNCRISFICCKRMKICLSQNKTEVRSCSSYQYE